MQSCLIFPSLRTVRPQHEGGFVGVSPLPCLDELEFRSHNHHSPLRLILSNVVGLLVLRTLNSTNKNCFLTPDATCEIRFFDLSTLK